MSLRLLPVFIALFSFLQTQAQTARFDNIRLEMDVVYNGAKGMKIHCPFRIVGAQGVPISINAWFYRSDGTKLMDTNGLFRTIDGQVSAYVNGVPPHYNSYFNSAFLFIPYDELHLSHAGVNRCCVMCGVFANGILLGTSNTCTFSVTTQSSAHTTNTAPKRRNNGVNNNGINKVTSNDPRAKRCIICGGSGKQKCVNCQGSGRNQFNHSKLCYSCNGKGASKCFSCDGRGYTFDYLFAFQPITDINTPDERIDVHAVLICNYCCGEGKKECVTCNGTNAFGFCRDCRGSGKKECSWCKGKKIVSEAYAINMANNALFGKTNSPELRRAYELYYSLAVTHKARESNYGKYSYWYDVAQMRETGLGCKKDIQIAKRYYQKAVEAGDSRGSRRIQQMAAGNFLNAETLKKELNNSWSETKTRGIKERLEERKIERELSPHERNSEGNCAKCNGTGFDPYPMQYDLFTGPFSGKTNQAGTKCPICGNYTKHYHTYCNRCKLHPYDPSLLNKH